MIIFSGVRKSRATTGCVTKTTTRPRSDGASSPIKSNTCVAAQPFETFENGLQSVIFSERKPSFRAECLRMQWRHEPLGPGALCSVERASTRTTVDYRHSDHFLKASPSKCRTVAAPLSLSQDVFAVRACFRRLLLFPFCLLPRSVVTKRRASCCQSLLRVTWSVQHISSFTPCVTGLNKTKPSTNHPVRKMIAATKGPLYL